MTLVDFDYRLLTRLPLFCKSLVRVVFLHMKFGGFIVFIIFLKIANLLKIMVRCILIIHVTVLPPQQRREGGTHSPGGEGGEGLIFWKTQDIGLASYSNNLYTGPAYLCERGRVWTQNIRLQVLLAQPPPPSF